MDPSQATPQKSFALVFMLSDVGGAGNDSGDGHDHDGEDESHCDDADGHHGDDEDSHVAGYDDGQGDGHNVGNGDVDDDCGVDDADETTSSTTR